MQRSTEGRGRTAALMLMTVGGGWACRERLPVPRAAPAEGESWEGRVEAWPPPGLPADAPRTRP